MFALPLLFVALAGCQDVPYEVTPVEGDNAKNYELAFHTPPPTNVIVVNSILYRYATVQTAITAFAKDRHEPDWEFELIVPLSWFEERKRLLKLTAIQSKDAAWNPQEIAPDWRAPWFAPGKLAEYDVWQSRETVPLCCHILVPKETASVDPLRLFFRKD